MRTVRGLLLPPIYFAASLCLMLALQVVLPGATVVAFPWTLVGIVPAAAGSALNLAADRAFKRHNTTVKPFEVPTSLVTEGVFAISRNPMYLGMTLILLGIALLLGSVTPFLVCPGFALLLEFRFIRPEERMLARQFGEQWEAYRSRVRRRWI